MKKRDRIVHGSAVQIVAVKLSTGVTERIIPVDLSQLGEADRLSVLMICDSSNSGSTQ